MELLRWYINLKNYTVLLVEFSFDEFVFSLSLLIHFGLKYTLTDINMATLACLLSQFVRDIVLQTIILR